MTDGIPEQNDPSYALLVGGFNPGDNFFTNTGEFSGQGGIMPFAVDETGHVYTYSAIDQAAVEATVTYPGAEYSAQIWGVSLMGAVVTESTIGGRTYTEISYQPLNLSSGGLLLTSAPFAGSTGSVVPTTAAFIAGTDGTDLRGLSVSSAGVLNVSDGTSHTTLSSILTQLDQFQFDGSGNLQVNVEAGGGSSDPSVGPTGSPVPADATLIGGLDPVGGVNLYAAGVDTDNRLYVIDQAVQQAVENTQKNDTSGSGQPIDIVGGWQPSASAFYALQLDAEGNLKVNGTGSSTTTTTNVTLSTSDLQGDPLPVVESNPPLKDAYTRLIVQEPNQPLVFNATLSPSTTLQFVSNVLPALVSGRQVIVTVTNTTTTQFPANLSIKVINTTTGIHGHYQSCGLLFGPSDVTLIFNVPTSPGDTVVIGYITPGSSFPLTLLSAVLVGSPLPNVLRPDGRGLPILSQSFNVAAATTGSTALAAPAAGFRLLFAGGGGTPSTIASTAASGVLGVINGSGINLVLQADSFTLYAPPGGILLDPATGLTNYSSAGNSAVFGFYDIVPI